MPRLVISPVSLYLAWKKLGTNVVASITNSHEHTIASRITHVDLSNLKNRSVSIYAIHVIVNDTISYKIGEFEPPLIQKELKSMRIETQRYSNLRLGVKMQEPESSFLDLTDTYLTLSNHMIKCTIGGHSALLPIKSLDRYRHAGKETQKFNGFVYSKNAAHAITYIRRGHVKMRSSKPLASYAKIRASGLILFLQSLLQRRIMCHACLLRSNLTESLNGSLWTI